MLLSCVTKVEVHYKLSGDSGLSPSLGAGTSQHSGLKYS